MTEFAEVMQAVLEVIYAATGGGGGVEVEVVGDMEEEEAGEEEAEGDEEGEGADAGAGVSGADHKQKE